MSEASRRAGRSVTRVAATALGGVAVTAGALGAAGTALMRQGRSTATTIETMALQAARLDGLVPPDVVVPLGDIPVPHADGVYDQVDGQPVGPVDPATWTGPRPVVLVMLGDSTSVGYGCRNPEGLPGVWLARRLTADLERPVRLDTLGKIGSGAADLDRQITESLALGPTVVVIITGANDITDQVPPWQSVRLLREAILRLEGEGAQVVVGSCPSFGVIPSIPAPLRQLLGLWSARLGTMQEKATRSVGARAVPIGREVSPFFRQDPTLFSADGFHPGEAGYALAAEALHPAVLEAFTDALS